MRTYSRIGLRLDGWTIVGHCPKCGAPIWGRGGDTVVEPALKPPVARFSCLCIDQQELERDRVDREKQRLVFEPVIDMLLKDVG